MDLFESYQAYLGSGDKPASLATVKNYLADARLLSRWYESTFKTELKPTSVTNEVISSYIQHLKSSSASSSSSIERRVSSLRKFVTFLNKTADTSITIFDNADGVKAITDTWRIAEFVTLLRSNSASDATLKNYLGDVKQFINWFARNIAHTTAEDVPAELVSKINDEMISEYVDFLSLATLSPASINRKLSSLRRYLGFIGSKTMIENVSNELKPVSKNEEGVQLVTQATTTAYSVEAAIKTPKTFSNFPPLRLMQKLGYAGMLAFDASIVAVSAVALEKMQYLSWVMLGKQIFSSSAKSGLGLGSKVLSAFKLPSSTESASIGKSLFANPIGRSSVRILSQLHPTHPGFAGLPIQHRILGHAKYSRPLWYKKYHSHSIVHYFHFAALILIMGGIGFGLYRSFVENPQKDKILAAAPTAPPRILSFQGRLTDSSDNPITSAKDLRFAIYNNSVSSGAALLWQETQYVTADTDGIFSVFLGSSVAIPASVFNDNSSLYLGITVQSDPELAPRQQIATVAFAANSETLQGLYPITAGGAGTNNVVLALDSSGNLTIGGSATPTFSATGGAFTLSGTVLNLQTTSGSNSNINITPDGRGLIELQKPARNSTLNNNIPSAAGAVEFDDMFAVLATSAAQNAVTFVQDGAGPIFSASAGATTRFLLANNGTITASGYSTGVAQFSSAGVLSSSALNLAGGASYVTGSLPTGNGGTGIGTYAVGDILYASGTTTLSALNIGASGRVLTVSGGIPAWIDPAGLSSSYWQRNLGALAPANITDDLLLGATSTSAARFAFINNIGSGAPTASISSNFSIQVPTGGANAAKINALNGGSLGFTTSVGGDAGATERLTILNGGNVGVGSTTPAQKLDVTGVIQSTGGYYISSSGVSLTRSSNDLLINVVNAAAMRFLTTNAERMRLDAGGNLGIATTSPLATLDVRANSGTTSIASISGLTSNAALAVDNNGVGDLFVASKSGATKFVVKNSGNVGIGTTLPSQLFDVQGGTGIVAQFSGRVIGGDAASSNEFVTLGQLSGGAGYWQLNGNALSPSISTYDLLLGATSTSSAKFGFINNAGGTPTATISSNFSIQVPTGGANAAKINILNGGSLGFRTSVGGDAGATERLTILNGGNIGVGTTAPGNLFDIGSFATSATISASLNSNTSYNTQLKFREADDTFGASILYEGTDNQLQLRTYNGEAQGAAALTLSRSSGNIAIGTTSTSNFKLKTAGSIGPETDDAYDLGSSGKRWRDLYLGPASLHIGTDLNEGIIGYNITDNYIGIDADGNASAESVFTDAGNLGIGTTNPATFKVEVAGSIGPTATNTYDLGSLAKQFNNTYTQNLYINGSLVNPAGLTNYWQLVGTVVSPAISSYDLAVGGTSTSSAKFQVFGLANGAVTAGTASTSGDLTFNGTSATQNINILNGSNLAFRNATSGQGDAGLATRMTLAASGNVGIGSITPGARLDLGFSPSTPGNMRLSSYSYLGNLYSSGAFVFGYNSKANESATSNVLVANTNAAVGYQYIKIDYTGGIQFHAIAGSVTADAVASAERMRIDPNGNVGIGTTAPVAKLDVEGATTLAQGQAISQINQTSTGDIFTASTSGTTRFVINNAGNVGIGTTAPTSILDIDTASNTLGIRLRGIAETTEIGDVYIGSAGQLVLSTANTGDTSPYIELDPEDDQYGLILRDGSTGTTAYTNFYMTDAATDYLNIAVNAATSTTGLVIADGGNVGIGTTTPTANLSIGTGIGTFTGISIGAAANRDIRIGQDSTHNLIAAWKYNATVGNAYAVFETYAGNNPLGLQTNGGNVGIGMTNPTSTLDITSSTAPDIRINSGGSAAQLSLSNSARDWWVQADNSPDIFAIEDQTAGAGIRLAIDGSGNVGIGTIAPIGLFNVDGRATGKALAIFNQNGGNQAVLTASISGVTKFLVDNNGNVGIGTIAPIAPLDVVGDIYGSSGISLYNTAVSDDTIEAAKFCTGDGETNCVTDFSSLVAGSSYWSKNSGNLYPTTLNDTISATSGATTVATFTTNNPGGTLTNNTLINHSGAGTVSNLLNLTRTAGTATNALSITGTFTNLISTPTFVLSNAGAASGLTGLASTGTIAFTGAGSFTIDSSAFDVTSGGAVSGVTTLTSSGSTTIGTGASSANTIGAGASSTNVIGSVTTPGALTLHGATTLDNTFTVSGSNLTSLGGNLTVTGTAWTATPTISGLITATSGLTANGAITANNTFTLGDNGDTGSINTSDWDIDITGVMTGISGITSNGGYTQSGATQNTFTGNLDATSGLDVSGANLTVADDLYVSSGISTFATAVSTGTVEATQFCTGDGETNCVTDFSSLVAGAGYWQRIAGNLSPATLNNTISATTSAAVALTLTQSGAFNALLVEDQASDTTPFIIDQNGNVGIGTTTASEALHVNGNIRMNAVGGKIGSSSNITTHFIEPETSDGDINMAARGDITLNLDSDNNGAAHTFQIWKDSTDESGTQLFSVSETGDTLISSNLNTLTAATLNIGTATQTGLTLGRVGATTAISGSTITAGSATTTAINLGNATSNPTLTLTGTGLTTLGGNLTVTGTAWTATPTISGLITATSGLTSNGTVAVNAAGGITTNQSTFSLVDATATTINFGGGATTALNIGPGSSTATSVNIAGGSGATGCTVSGATGDLTCSGAITGSGGALTNLWQRIAGNLSPVNLNDTISATSSASTVATHTTNNPGGTLTNNTLIQHTAAGTVTNLLNLTQSAGTVTNAISTTGTFGNVLSVGGTPILNATGVLLSAGLSGTYSNTLTLSGASNAITAGTLTATGGSINGTTIGASTPSTGAFTTLNSSGATTLGTGVSLTNTFGSGASSVNTIGAVTTPGALTLHGATTLDNTFTVSGSNLTSLGGNLTVTGTAWTATPTISGLITATSGVSVAAGQSYSGAGAVTLSSGGAAGLTLDSASNTLTLAATDTTLTASGLATISLGTSATINAGATGLNLQADGSIDVNIAGGSGATGCSVANSTGNLVCTGSITGSGGALTNLWQRALGALAPANITDDLLIGGSASTSATFQVLALSKDAGAITAGTASTSGDLTFRGAASDINLLGNAVFNIKNSIGGDAGLVTRLTLTANGNVGIGTTVPIGKLHVEGAATGRALATFNETGGQDIFTASASGTPRFVIRNSGNVGIGTILPGQLLSVAGFIEGQRFVDSTNNSFFVDPAATGVSFTSAGFVGVGTSNPTTYLHVDGATTLAQGQALAVLNQTGGSDILAASASGTMRFLIRASGNIGVGTLTNPLGLFSVTGATTTAQGQALLQVNQTGTADIFTASTSGVAKFVINNGGNVGIGTTAPAALLQVSSAVAANANGQEVLRLSGVTAAGTVGSGPFLEFTDSSNNFIGSIRSYTQASGQVGMAFTTLTTSSSPIALFLNHDGNVGIGTTSPVGLLNVNGRVTGKALALFNETGNQDIFTASASGSTKFTIANNGDLILGGRDLDVFPKTGQLRAMATTGTNQGGAHLYLAAGNGTGTGLGGDLVLRTGQAATSSAALVAANLTSRSNYISSGPGMTFTQTVSGSNPVLVVGVAYRDTATITVRFRGVNLTEIGTEAGTAGQYVRQFYMANPDPGSGEVHVFSSDTTQAMAANAVTLNNVNTATPYTNTQTATGNSVTPSVTVNSAQSDLVVGVAAHNDTGTCTPGSFEVELADVDSGLATDPGLCSDYEQAGTTTTTISHTTSSQPWTIRATAFRPTPSTSNTALIDRLRITQNGNIGIGISSPSARLSIFGGIYMESPLGSVNINPGQDISALNPGTTTTGTVYEGAASRHLIFDLKNNSQTDAVAFRYSGANTGTVDSIGLVMKGDGNIGIGTTAPGNLTQIYMSNNNGSTTNFSLVQASTGVVGMRYTRTSTADWFVGMGGSSSTVFKIDYTGTAPSTPSTNASFNITTAGNVGIGTSTVGQKLDVEGNVELNLNTAGSSTEAVCGTSTTEGASNTVLDDCTTSVFADYMEMYPMTNDTSWGDIVAIGSQDVYTTNNHKIKQLTRSATPYDSKLMGVHSNEDDMGDFNSIGYNIADGDNPKPLALAGRVRVKVSSINGPINPGDMITSSSIAGVGMKSTKAGMVIGQALNSYSSANPNQVGTVMVFIKAMWYDPAVYIAESGNFNITGGSEGTFQAWAGGYKFENKGGFADAAIARLTAGIVKTEQLVVNGTATFLGAVQMQTLSVAGLIQAQALNVGGAISAGSVNAGTIAVSNLSIGGQALSDYIISVVQNAGFNNSSNLVAPIANIDRVNTDIISPLATGEINIDGNVKTKNLAVNGDATISGTLRADKIIANDIEGLNARIASIAANTITASSAAITNIYNNTYLASGSANASGGASMIASSIDTNFANIGSLSANLAYVPSLTSDFGTFSQGLMSFGATSLADTSIAGQLSVNGSLILADNTINTLGSPLEIQPLRQGALSFMGGLVAIDIDGNLSVAGNATFAKDVTVQGTLAANIISPVPNEDLILQLPGYDDGTTLAMNRPGITVKNGSGSAVLKITDVGDIIASGAALASQFQVVRGAQADTSLITSVATASAGTATIKAGQLERTIQNSRVTADSLIYITAASDTSGKTPFVARQVAEDVQTGTNGSFTIRIPQAISLDAKVNWWIIN